MCQEDLDQAYDLITQSLISSLEEDNRLPDGITPVELRWFIRGEISRMLATVLHDLRRSLPATLAQAVKEAEEQRQNGNG